MAFDGNLVTRSHTAAADLSAAQYKFVALNSADKVDVVGSAGLDCYGVLQNDPVSGGAATVARSGTTKVVAGGAITVGAYVSIDSSARAVATAYLGAVGICRKAVSNAGEIATIELFPVPRVLPPFSFGVPTLTTASGTVTLTTASTIFQRIDPGGAGRNVVLPSETLSFGRAFYIANFADAAESLTIKASDTTTTIETVDQNEAAWFVCDGTTWQYMGGLTSAIT